MAVSNYQLFIYNNGRQIVDSKGLEVLVKSISVSADAGVTNTLTIKEGADALANMFDFGGKVLANLGAPSANGHALRFDMLGANSGIAQLDAGGKVPVAQLPNSIMDYKGTYDPTADTGAGLPALANSGMDPAPSSGDVYKVTVAGSHNFGAGALSMVVGDYVIWNGTVWEVAHSGADAVVSVNSQAGAVVLDADDISDAATTNKYYTATAARSDLIASSISDGDTTHAPDGNSVFDALALKADDSAVVKSVNGVSPTTGAVTLDTDDISDAAATNKYYTATAARGDLIASSIADDDTTHAPSGNAVFDALALKANLTDLGGSQYVSLTNKEAETAIVAGKFVKMLVAGQMTLLSAADSVGEETFFGCAKSASTAVDAAGDVYIPEVGSRVTGYTDLDVTKLLYATTAGGYTQTRPTTGKVIILGRPISATEIVFIGKVDYVYG